MTVAEPTGVAGRVMIDTNVLVFASVPAAPDHAGAVAALHREMTGPDEIWISRQIVREFLVQIARPGVLHDATHDRAARQAEWLTNNFRLADETAAVTSELFALLRTVGFRGKNVHDANIVATMLAHGISRLLTHNVKDFDRYADAGLIAVETF